MEKEKKTVKKSKINQFNLIFVDIQVVITIMTIVLAILYMLSKTSLKMFELSLGINLLVMAFNNYKIYKRSRLTILYAIVGIIVLICLGV